MTRRSGLERRVGLLMPCIMLSTRSCHRAPFILSVCGGHDCNFLEGRLKQVNTGIDRPSYRVPACEARWSFTRGEAVVFVSLQGFQTHRCFPRPSPFPKPIGAHVSRVLLAQANPPLGNRLCEIIHGQATRRSELIDLHPKYELLAPLKY